MVGKKIDERTFDFAFMIVDVYKFLLGKKEFVLSKQLLRAGTSESSFEFWVLGFELWMKRRLMNVLLILLCLL